MGECGLCRALRTLCPGHLKVCDFGSISSLASASEEIWVRVEVLSLLCDRFWPASDPKRTLLWRPPGLSTRMRCSWPSRWRARLCWTPSGLRAGPVARLRHRTSTDLEAPTKVESANSAAGGTSSGRVLPLEACQSAIDVTELAPSLARSEDWLARPGPQHSSRSWWRFQQDQPVRPPSPGRGLHRMGDWQLAPKLGTACGRRKPLRLQGVGRTAMLSPGPRRLSHPLRWYGDKQGRLWTNCSSQLFIR